MTRNLRAYVEMPQTFCCFHTPAQTHCHLQRIYNLVFRLLNTMNVGGLCHLQCNIAELSSLKEVKKRAVEIFPSLVCFEYKDIIFTITAGRSSLLLLWPPFSLHWMLFCLLWDHGFWSHWLFRLLQRELSNIPTKTKSSPWGVSPEM